MTRDDIKEALSAILKHRSKPEPDESLEGDISGTHHNENDINPDDVIEIDSDDIEFNTRDANELIGDSYKDKETVLTVEYSNESSLSSEERIEVNKRIAIPQATDYLASKGFDLSNSSTSRNIMNDVVSPSGEKCTVCVKSSSRETVELASHEIEAMHLSGKNFFLLIVCRKQNTFNHSHIRFFSFDDLLKSNETYSISFRTKDYTDNNMAAFINAIKFLPGTTLKFVINDESLKYADNEINDSFENIDNLVKRVDSSYINTTKDDDGDF
jgi:Holliday junction resolvase